MLKDYGIIKKISGEISAAAENAVNTVFRDYSDTKGREEEMTAQIRGEINRHLLKNISEKLNGQEINGCKIEIATFKKMQESKVGADLAGIVTIVNGTSSVSKAFLAQAKVGQGYNHGGQEFARAKNRDVLRQANDMLNLSSDSFVFIYSPKGIFCIPAFQIVLGNSNTIDTAKYPYHSFGTFFEEFFKCFIGDHKISPLALGATGLEDYAEKIKAQAMFQITVNLKHDKNRT